MSRVKNNDMVFADHVIELRNRLFASLLVIAALSVVGYFLFPFFFDFIFSIISEELYVTKIYEGFITRLKVSLLIGLLLSIPFLLSQLLAFIMPALARREKIIIVVLITCSFLLFIGGILFSLRMVLPISIDFLRSQEFFPTNLDRIISYDLFIVFFFQFLIAFGLCLQFPVIILILLYFKVIKRPILIKYLKYFIALAFLVSGILTPPDIVSQIMLSLPIIIMYLLCIIIAGILNWG